MTAVPPEISARLFHPTVRISGPIDDLQLQRFYDQLGPVLQIEGAILFEVFTSGGDAEVGRRMAEEIRLLRRHEGRDCWFLGKTSVYSAGTNFMAGFARDRRWLTRDCTLLLHGRRVQKTLNLNGPLEGVRRQLEEQIAEMTSGLKFEEEIFGELIEGSQVGLEDLKARARLGWYVSAEEALSLGLVAGLI
jgi:ATP-dependent protease ClpP protease subunit